MERLLRYAGWLFATLLLLTVLAYAGIELRMFRPGLFTKVTVTDTSIAYGVDTGGVGIHTFVRHIHDSLAGPLPTEALHWMGYKDIFSNTGNDSINLPLAWGVNCQTFMIPFNMYPDRFQYLVSPGTTANRKFRSGITWNLVPVMRNDSVYFLRLRRWIRGAGDTAYMCSIYKVGAVNWGTPANTLGQQVDMIELYKSDFPPSGTAFSMYYQNTMRKVGFMGQ